MCGLSARQYLSDQMVAQNCYASARREAARNSWRIRLLSFISCSSVRIARLPQLLVGRRSDNAPTGIPVFHQPLSVQSSRPLPIAQISPGDNVESGIASIDPSGATLSDEFPCPDDYFDAPEDQSCCVPILHHDAVETFDPYPTEMPLNV
jgi:hypothetical protein